MVRAWLAQRLFPRTPRGSGVVAPAAIFLAKYLIGLGAAVLFFLGGFLRRRHRMLLNQVLFHLGFAPAPLRAELRVIPIDDAVPPDTPVALPEAEGRDGNVSLLELLVLARLVATRRPERLFEIGTFDGRTTLTLAANCAGEVFTLDLPPSGLDTTLLPLAPGDESYIAKPKSGERFMNRPEARRITQLFGDSATFDFSPWDETVDFIFVDGAHSREYVLSDTRRALRLLRPAGGMILWHDYDASFDGVTEALDELARGGMDIRRIAGTSLAILTLTRSP